MCMRVCVSCLCACVFVCLRRLCSCLLSSSSPILNILSSCPGNSKLKTHGEPLLTFERACACAQVNQQENIPEPASPVLDSAVVPSANDDAPVIASPAVGFNLFRAAMGIASSVASAVSSNSVSITSPSFNFQVPSPQEVRPSKKDGTTTNN